MSGPNLFSWAVVPVATGMSVCSENVIPNPPQAGEESGAGCKPSLPRLLSSLGVTGREIFVGRGAGGNEHDWFFASTALPQNDICVYGPKASWYGPPMGDRTEVRASRE